MRQISQWRTFGGTLALAVILLLGLVFAGDSAGYALFAPSVSGLGLWLAGKSAVEHRAKAPEPPQP